MTHFASSEGSYSDRPEHLQAFYLAARVFHIQSVFDLSAGCLQPFPWQLSLPQFGLEAVPGCPALPSKAGDASVKST